jgi:uncharacterized protein YjbI with pentapeptide repeats
VYKNDDAFSYFMKTSKGIYKSLSVKVLLCLLFLLIGTTAIYKLYQYNWSGFGEDSNKSKSIEKTIKDGKIISIKESETEHFQSGKTLWDWLGLGGTIAIPVMIYVFQLSEQRRAEERAKVEKEQAEELAKIEKEQAEQREKFEKAIAEANLREEAFQAYIDRMSEILINKRSRSELYLLENGSNYNYKDNSVRDVARIRTVTILRRLENDIERQDRVLSFLRDTELFQFILRTANLSGANLSGANLSGANLSGANLSNANLSSVNLSNAELFGANFTNANLANANLENSWIQDTKFRNTDLSNARLVNARTWNEEGIDFNFELREVDGDEFGPSYQDERFFQTDFSEAKLTDANLVSTNLRGAENLTVEQLKEAKDWDEAIYDDELFKKLGLPKTLKSIIDTMPKDADENVDVEKLIGYQVEVRDYTDNGTETITRGEITGFSKSNHRVNVKTSNGEQLDKLSLWNVYVYIT